MRTKTQPVKIKPPPELPKEMWGAGEWQNEPDRIEFKHKGMDCLLQRNDRVTGSWCGYVAVGPKHLLHGVEYNKCARGCKTKKPDHSWMTKTKDKNLKNIGQMTKAAIKRGGTLGRMMDEPRHVCLYESNHTPESILSVHGGLTYSGACRGVICHKPAEGEHHEFAAWWFGFDCAHAGDVSPRMDATMRQLRSVIPSLPELPSSLGGWSTYRNVAYVKKETMHLADQLANLAGNSYEDAPIEKIPVMTVAKATISGPRWAGIKDFIKDMAAACDVKVKAISIKGIVRETVSFEVSGTEANVARAMQKFKEAIEQHNK